MASNATTADVAPEEVTQTSSDDDAGDIDDTSNLAQAEVIVVGANAGSDVTSEEYSSRV